MKITDSKSAIQTLEPMGGKPPTQRAVPSGPEPGESTRLSALSNELSALESRLSSSPAFDAEKVESIKQAIRDGRFRIDSGAIADKLLTSVREFLKEPH